MCIKSLKVAAWCCIVISRQLGVLRVPGGSGVEELGSEAVLIMMDHIDALSDWQLVW